MRKTRIWVCLCILFCCISCNRENICFVDASSTSPQEDGSREHPFKTVEAAFEAVSSQDNGQYAHIIIRQGTYRFDKGILIGKSLSGLTLSAYPGEEVIFTGGVSIPVQLVRKQTEGNRELSVIDLKEAGITDWGEIHNAGFSRRPKPPGENCSSTEHPCISPGGRTKEWSAWER